RTAFSHALDAELGVGGRRLHMMDANGWNLGRPGQEIIGEGRGKRLSIRVEWALLVECGTNALGRSPECLAFDHHRIHEYAAILDDDVIENLDAAHLGVDGHDRGMRGIAERTRVAFGTKAHR